MPAAFHDASAENARRVLQKLSLPAGILVRVHIIMRCKLRDCLLAF